MKQMSERKQYFKNDMLANAPPKTIQKTAGKRNYEVRDEFSDEELIKDYDTNQRVITNMQ